MLLFNRTEKVENYVTTAEEQSVRHPAVASSPVKGTSVSNLDTVHLTTNVSRSGGDPLAGNPSPSVLQAIDHSDGTRTCSRCNERKPLSAFYKDKLATKGHRSYCKECQKQGIRDNYNKGPKKKK